MRDRYSGDIVRSYLSENNLGGDFKRSEMADVSNLAVCLYCITDTPFTLSLPCYSMAGEVLEPINHQRSFPIMHIHYSIQHTEEKYGVRIVQGD